MIDTELRLCRTLADETHLEKCPGFPDDLPHHWELPASLHRDIRPREDSYVYIDGAFRPNTRKLLELLSGIELYGQPLAALRELLQNSFDAVREQIAYERFAQPNPADPSIGRTLSQLHSVELRLESSADGAWLVCTDSGVGMTKEIIRDHFLVSGTPRRHDVLKLERRCNAHGFPLGRTGQFGIGVLSYFMLANRMTLATRRRQQAGDAENTGWEFETEGIGSFGELRQNTSLTGGTEVRLHLRQGTIDPDLVNAYSQMRKYLAATLLRIPCRFQFRSTIPACETLTLDPGWTTNSNARLNSISADLLKTRGEPRTAKELLSLARRQELESSEHHWSEVKKEADGRLRWIEEEGDLPNGLGSYRINIPYFDLAGGASAAFLRAHESNDHLYLERIGQGYVYIPSGELQSAWKGMRVETYTNDHRYPWRPKNFFGPAFIEIDWHSPEAGTVSVNRGVLLHSLKAQRAVSWLAARVSEKAQAFVTQNKHSNYDALNRRISNSELPLDKELIKWLAFEGTEDDLRAVWKPLSFPMISILALGSITPRYPANRFTWGGKTVSIVPCLNGPNEPFLSSGLAWHSNETPPDRIIYGALPVNRSVQAGLTPLWAEATGEGSHHVAGMTCQLPPQWTSLCGVDFEHYSEAYKASAIVWNPDHPLLRSIDAAGWEWSRKQDQIDPLTYKGALLTHRSHAASWILRCLANKPEELWEGLKDRDPDFLPALWRLLLGDMRLPICFWTEDGWDSMLHILITDKWQRRRLGDKEVRQYLPDPGFDWSLRMEPETSV